MGAHEGLRLIMNGKNTNFRGMLMGVGFLPVVCGHIEAQEKNRYVPYPAVENLKEGISWPKGQAIPIFSTPAEELDMVVVQDLSKDEQLTFSALQGLVNKKQPRIYLENARTEEGSDTWPNTPTVNIPKRNRIPMSNKYDLVKKYAKEVAGVILYDPAKSPHYRNLAGTVAGLHGALPVTQVVYDQLKEQGINLRVVEDLSGLAFTTPVEIYSYLYDKYWGKCEKRLIVSAKPHDQKGGGNYHHTRDIAIACGAAVVWLDTLIPEEKAVFEKFLGDMKAGEAIALGWYSTERSGVTTVSKFGIGTLPADFFISASVFAGTDHRIAIPPVPKMPELENKVYVAIFISDGDNIQYTQHAMRRIWDGTASSRGKIPLNWTIAPGLVDIGPGIMNYYYGSATPNDCFVTGPSGMGYAMPSNTLTEPGAPVGDYMTDEARAAGYARLTETYLQRSGLRVITIWDNAPPVLRAAYEKYGRNLYGATVQNFKDVPSVAGGVENNRLKFDKLIIPYAGSYEHIHSSMKREISRWDGKEPLFLAYQVDIWNELKPDRILALHDEVNQEFKDKKTEFVRADHYFNLANEAGGQPFNLCMAPKTKVRSGDGSAVEAVTDGTPKTLWSSAAQGKQWLGFDFEKAYRIHRCVVRHAGDQGMKPVLNTRAFAVQASLDGKSWKTVYASKGNVANVSDIEFPKVDARYVKVNITDAGGDGTARVADVEIYGSR
jgi:hypothetical protein